MIKYLQSKKGFTLIELIVVLAILGVMMAIILPNINVRQRRINAANSTARDFYAAVQSVFTKYSLYESKLFPYYVPENPEIVYNAANDPNLQYMTYYPSLNGNYLFDPATVKGDMPKSTDLYLEIAAKNGEIQHTYVAAYERGGGVNGMVMLCGHPTSGTDNAFGQLLAEELKGRINYQDGFYYAKVSYTAPAAAVGGPSKQDTDTIKVMFTAFMQHELPVGTSSTTLVFGDDNVLANGEICGTCAAWNSSTGNYIGCIGTQLV